MIHLRRAACAGLLALCVAGTARADVSIESTSNTTFAFPDPQGMRSVKNTAAPFAQSMGRASSEQGQRLLVLWVPLEDARAVNSGGAPEGRELASAASPVALEPKAYTREEFKVLRGETLAGITKYLGAPPPQTEAELETALEAALVPKGANAAQLAPLGVYTNDDRAFVHAAITGTTDRKVMVLATVNVKNRVINLTYLKKVVGRGDVVAARKAMAAWIEAFVKANAPG